MVLGSAAPATEPAEQSYPERPVRVLVGLSPGGGIAAEFGAYLKSERDKWARVVKLSGAKVE